MKILLIGAGGREHALAWRLAQSPRVRKVYVAPGNGGIAWAVAKKTTAATAELENLAITDLNTLADFAEQEHIALTVVGPEAPLAAGVVDLFQRRGLKIFGPTQAAAQLESSKDFAKTFMARHGIPTARHATFTDAPTAHAYIDRAGAPIVVKADGLAAGKGVVVAQTAAEAHAAIDHMLGTNTATPTAPPATSPGARVVIEACLSGEEASFIVMSDGTHVLALATSQDHKRLYDGDLGPNTGGMGAYSPAPVVTPAMHQRIMHEIILPTIAGMRRDGMPYVGFLYAGVMIAPGEDPARPIHTLEFNCRLGDPETQPIMMRLQGDLVSAIEHALAGTLEEADIRWDPRPALGVVMAAANYPDAPRTGDLITGLSEASENDKDNAPIDHDCMVFHAGTRLSAEHNGQLVTAGGRVLCVTALGDSLHLARERAYARAASIQFAGSQYRRDIGWRALSPQAQGSCAQPVPALKKTAA